ncbi:MAG TPA: YlqD family protein [Symbiobacteriaceae bacterium]|nr:YlqD family protein [Symbiobacteriaceae bacterium]
MSIQLIRPVTIKALVTDGLKDRLNTDMREAIKVLEEETARLDSEVKRAQLMGNIPSQQLLQLNQVIAQEKAKRADRKAQLEEEIQAVAALPLGSEIVQGQAQSLTTVAVGDDLEAALGVEIVVQDGKIIEIREGVK